MDSPIYISRFVQFDWAKMRKFKIIMKAIQTYFTYTSPYKLPHRAHCARSRLIALRRRFCTAQNIKNIIGSYTNYVNYNQNARTLLPVMIVR